MSLRGRFLLVSLLVAILPLASLAFGLRRESARQLRDLYSEQVARLEIESRQDLAEQGERIDRALSALRERLLADDRFRDAVTEQRPEDQRYRVDLGQRVMGLTGLDVFEVQDGRGRIVTSGHFREQFDRPGLPWPSSRGRPLFAEVSSPSGSRWMRIRTLSFDLAGASYRMMGGAAADWTRSPGDHAAEADAMGGSMGPDGRISAPTPDAVWAGGAAGITVRVLDAKGNSLHVGQRPKDRSPSQGRTLPGPDTGSPESSVQQASGSSDSNVSGSNAPGSRASGSNASAPNAHSGAASEWFRRDVPVALFRGQPPQVESGRIAISASTTHLDIRLAELDRWFFGAALATVVFALILAFVAAGALSRPLQALAEKTTHVRIGRRYVNFRSDRKDELGDLSRFIGVMVDRLQGSAEQLREAERTATVGEIARQVHHDIRNGLTPIRNVMRHLSEVSRRTPEELAAVFAERSGTIDAGLQYLDELSTNYARLTPRQQRIEVDLNVIIHAVTDPLVQAGIDIRLALAHESVRILADPVGLRRIVENLVRNASESLESSEGWVEVRTERVGGGAGVGTGVGEGKGLFTGPGLLLSVRDTGVGMDEDIRRRVFDHFYSTKPTGVGLGLGIVKRLVADFSGRIDLESAPGIGTTFRIWFPEAMRSGSTERIDAGPR